MEFEPALIIEVPRGSAVERQLADDPPAGAARPDVVVEVGETDALGNLEPADGGEVVLAVPAPEALSRDPDAVQRVIAEAAPGDDPLVVVVEAAEELLDEDLGLVLEAARDFGYTRYGEGRGSGAAMALDHRRILATALGRLRGKIKYRPVVFELLPPTFTLLQLQQVVEALAGVRLHKQNFRRLVENAGLVEGTGRQDAQTGGRPAELFVFRREVDLPRPRTVAMTFDHYFVEIVRELREKIGEVRTS